MYMVTLTYSNESIPYFVSSNPEIGKVCYPLQKDVADMFKRIRRNNLFGSEFKYFGVSEYGGKRMRPHFHILIAIPKIYTNEKDNETYGRSMEAVISRVLRCQWKRNIALNAKGKVNTRKPIWQSCSLFVGRLVRGKWKKSFDCHFVEPRAYETDKKTLKRYISDDVSFYVTKYILKEDDRINKLVTKLMYTDKENYTKYASKMTPRVFMSHDFGSLVADDKPLIRKYIALGLNDKSCLNPMFVGANGNLYNCGRFLLRQMVKHKFITIDEQAIFAKRRLAFVLGLTDTIELSDDDLIAEYNRKQRLMVKRPALMRQLRDKHTLSSDYLDMDISLNSFVDYYVSADEMPVVNEELPLGSAYFDLPTPVDVHYKNVKDLLLFED